MRKLLLFIVFAISGIVFTSCYTEVIDNLSTFTFQLILDYKSEHNNRGAPDMSYDTTNLYEYEEYRNHKDQVDKAMILHFNYWIDSLTYKPVGKDTTVVFDRLRDTNKFEFVKIEFWWIGSKIDGTRDDSKTFLLGRFTNVKIEDYFRYPQHIIYVPDSVAQKVSDIIKSHPRFYLKSVYSKLRGQAVDTVYFPFVKARYDMTIRFDVKL